MEALGLFVVSTAMYFLLGYSWLIFLLMIFSFDISMIGYLVNKKFGAILYNIGHSLFLPLFLLLFAVFYHHQISLLFALVWFAHIGMDRAMGYGLKSLDGFTETHLGKIGGIK